MRVLILLLFFSLGLLGCGGDSELAEDLGISGEVSDISASRSTIAVGESVAIEVEVTTGEFFGFNEVFILVRFGPELRFIDGSGSFDITGVIDPDEPFTIGLSDFGFLEPICFGTSNSQGDQFVGFRLRSRIFQRANNDEAEISFRLRAIAASPQVFIVASARNDLESNECVDLAPTPDEAVDISILP